MRWYIERVGRGISPRQSVSGIIGVEMKIEIEIGLGW